MSNPTAVFNSMMKDREVQSLVARAARAFGNDGMFPASWASAATIETYCFMLAEDCNWKTQRAVYKQENADMEAIRAFGLRPVTAYTQWDIVSTAVVMAALLKTFSLRGLAADVMKEAIREFGDAFEAETKMASDLDAAWGRTVVAAKSQNPFIPAEVVTAAEALMKKAEDLFADAKALVKKADVAHEKAEKDYEAKKAEFVTAGGHPDDFSGEEEGLHLANALTLLERFNRIHGTGQFSTYYHVRRLVDMMETDVEHLTRGR